MTRRTGRSATAPIPWLSGLLLGVCLVFSIHAWIERDAATRGLGDALEEARSYFLAHPYLEAGDALTAHLTPEGVATARHNYEERRSAAGWVRTPPGVVRRQQEELAARIENARGELKGLPARAVAVVPADGFSKGWFLYLLLQRGPLPLVGNALLLLLLGVYLERSFGRIGFAVLASAVTLAGAGGWVTAAPDPEGFGLVSLAPPLAGLLTAFAIRFASQRDEGFYLAGLVLGVLWLALPPWLGADWFFADMDPIAPSAPLRSTLVYWAYLGSAGAGTLGAVAAGLLGLDGERPSADASPAMRDPRFRRAMRAREGGRPREALELLAEQLAAEPDAYEVALAMWELASELGRDAEAETALLRAIRIEQRRGFAAAAVDHWLVLAEGGAPEAAEPTLLVHMALLLREQGYREPAVHALRCALERSESRESHVIATRIARAARGLDPGVVESAAWRALGSLELDLRERQALEDLIGEALEAPGTSAAPAPSPRPATIAIDATRPRALEAVVAVPLELSEEGLSIQSEQGAKKIVRYERIEAVSVVAVQGIAPKPVLIVDLILNWKAPAHEPLRLIRVRGDRFDPRSLFPGQTSAVDALRSFVTVILDRAGATPLPDTESALGRPFASFEELVLYQRAVLMVDDSASS